MTATRRPWQVVRHRTGKPLAVVRTYSTRDAALALAADAMQKIAAAGITDTSYAVRRRR